MKQETKELIDWIKKQINLAKENCIDVVWNGKHECYNADYEKAMDFLDSLPQIESHLCLGGYIQDKNGTLCCHGDKVNFQYGEGFYNGTLTYNFTSKCFTIVTEDGGVFFWTNGAIKWFEKV